MATVWCHEIYQLEYSKDPTAMMEIISQSSQFGEYCDIGMLSEYRGTGVSRKEKKSDVMLCFKRRKATIGKAMLSCFKRREECSANVLQ